MNIKLFYVSVSVIVLSGHATNASPFMNPRRWGDMFMVMPTVYAIGMTMVTHDYTGMGELGASVVGAQMVTEGIKLSVNERRPNGNDNKSFPSGHASGAFSGAMFVHKRYGWRPAILPYTFSVITGYSRVYARAHYWHDVLGGAAVSALVTWALVDKYDKTINISANPDGVGLRFLTTF